MTTCETHKQSVMDRLIKEQVAGNQTH